MSALVDRSQSLVMLMGSPRSGTTWLAKIIDSHPAVLYRHEPDSINVNPEIPFVPEAAEVDRHMAACRDYLQLLVGERASKSSGSQPMFSKDFRGPVSEAFRRLLILGVKGGERIPLAGSLLSGIQVPDLITGQAAPRTFIKSVSSLCRSYMFSLADPQARFIHIIRHPCAYVASTVRGKKLGLLSDDPYIETLAAMSQASSYGLTLEKLLSLSREEQLAARWMLQNEKVMQEMSGLEGYQQVIYEALCARPLEVAETLLAFMGLEMNDQTRSFIEQSSGGKSGEVRYFDVTRDSAAAASSWMSELDNEQISSIRQLVSPSKAGGLYFEG